MCFSVFLWINTTAFDQSVTNFSNSFTLIYPRHDTSATVLLLFWERLRRLWKRKCMWCSHLLLPQHQSCPPLLTLFHNACSNDNNSFYLYIYVTPFSQLKTVKGVYVNINTQVTSCQIPAHTVLVLGLFLTWADEGTGVSHSHWHLTHGSFSYSGWSGVWFRTPAARKRAASSLA